MLFLEWLFLLFFFIAAGNLKHSILFKVGSCLKVDLRHLPVFRDG